MRIPLKNLSEIVAKANDLFFAKYENTNTLMGLIDKTLRDQGMKADAITIDCIAMDKKIVVLIHDDKPDVVDIAIGNKDGDIFSSTQHLIKDISVAFIVDVMEVNFL